MRRCSIRHLEQWPSQDLPILPFLAPRIFAPWLFREPRHRSFHAEAPAAQCPGSLCTSTKQRSRRTSNHTSRLQASGNPSRCLKLLDIPYGRRQLHSTHKALDEALQNPKHAHVEEEQNSVRKTEGINSRISRAPDEVDDAGTEESGRFADETTILDATIGSKLSHERPADNPTVNHGYHLAKIYAYGKSARGGAHGSDDLVIQQALHSAKRGDVAETIQALKLLPHERLDDSDLSVLKIASLLLRQSKRGGGQYESSSTIVAALSGIGMTLNLAMFNILILNAAETNDPATAWRIYNLLQEQEVKPDDYTHTILLSMCRRLGDRVMYKKLYHELDPENLSYSPILLTEIMACRYHFNARQNMGHILRFYELHFWMQPLRALGIVNQEMERILIERPRNENITKQYPYPATIGLMIRVHSRQTQRQAGTKLVYDNFQQMIRAEDPLIMPLLATTHTYNAFIKALFGKPSPFHKDQYSWPIVSILRDMEQAVPSHIINETTGLPLVQASPDLQTFNIILNAKMKLSMLGSARRTWSDIYRAKLVPDLVSWNTLLQGFAKAQRFDTVIKILLKMMSQGLEPDEHTYIALHDIEDQELLEKMLMDPLEPDRVLEAASNGTLDQFPGLPWHSAKRSKVTGKTKAAKRLSPTDERRYKYLMRYVREAVEAHGRSPSSTEETIYEATAFFRSIMKTPWEARKAPMSTELMHIAEKRVNTPKAGKAASKTARTSGEARQTIRSTSLIRRTVGRQAVRRRWWRRGEWRHRLERPQLLIETRSKSIAEQEGAKTEVAETGSRPVTANNRVQQLIIPREARETLIKSDPVSMIEKEPANTLEVAQLEPEPASTTKTARKIFSRKTPPIRKFKAKFKVRPLSKSDG